MASSTRRSLRRNRVDERWAIAVALVGGIAAVAAGAEPTGETTVDAVLVVLGVAVVTWAAASAPWWTVTAAAAIGAAIALDPVVTAVGAVALVAGLWIGLRRRDLGTVRAVVAATALNVLIRSDLGVVLGLSAAVGVVVGAALFVLGIRRRSRTIRFRAWLGVGAVGVAMVLAVLGFGASAASARGGLTDGSRLARDGIAALDDGDFQLAAQQFRDAATAFGRADQQLGRPWAAPARAVPVVAQNRDATAELAATAESASTDLAEALGDIDPDRLRLVDGRFDIAAIEAVEQPLMAVAETLTDLRGTIDDVESQWLFDPIQRRVADLEQDIDENEEPLSNAVSAVELAPEMLGSEGARRYFLAFTTPAEARGLGGFMGNYAILRADDGRLRVSQFGRTTELNQGGDLAGTRTVTGPESWLDRYGQYGFTNGPDGSVGAAPWSNVTVSPHFPSTAQVIAELYPQSGGRSIDGVIAMDTYVLEAFLGFTGAIEIEATDEQLTAENVEQFVLKDQYEIDDDADRVDLIEQVAEETIDRMLDGALPGPADVAETLGPLAAEGRLVAWSSDADEQALFDEISMSGALPRLDGDDGVAVVVNNAAANKIDVYLERELSYEATVDPASGAVEGTVTVVLRNRAPQTGLPNVVLGNRVGDPPGTNRSLVSLYTAVPVTAATVDGETVSFAPGSEEGWRTATTTVQIPPGGNTTIVAEIRGILDLGDDGYSLSTRPQPLVAPERHDLLVRGVGGTTLVNVNTEADAPQRLTAMT